MLACPFLVDALTTKCPQKNRAKGVAFTLKNCLFGGLIRARTLKIALREQQELGG